MSKFYFFFISISTCFFNLQAQDTVKINLQQADSLFLSKSFYLMASSMNIEVQKAQILQKKLYPNPVFTADYNAYDPDRNKAFHTGKTGQKGFQLEQLILIGGKRKSEIEMAKTNTQIAELEFQQLMRQLKYHIHSDLFTIGQQKLLLKRYNSQLSLLDTLLHAYQIQAEKGNIPLKDVVRLKGAYLKLNNDRAELLKHYYEAQAKLQTLLQLNEVIEFRFSEQEIEKYIKQIPLSEIHAEALANRPELLIAQQDKVLAEQYVAFQKKQAIPDITLFTYYDQRGGAFNNQINTGIALPLPLWNRNQGNIRSSEFKIKEADYNVQAMQNEIVNDLRNSVAFYDQTVSEYKKATSIYSQDFEITVKGMTDNFQKRNISIVEFIDFFEAYNEVLTELTRIRTQVVISAEQLNLLIGKDMY